MDVPGFQDKNNSYFEIKNNDNLRTFNNEEEYKRPFAQLA